MQNDPNPTCNAGGVGTPGEMDETCHTPSFFAPLSYQPLFHWQQARRILHAFRGGHPIKVDRPKLLPNKT